MSVSPSKWLKKLLFWTPIVMAAAVALAVAAMYGLQYSDSARQALVEVVSGLASSEDFKLELEGLEGRPPWHFSLKHVLVADRQGLWLAAEDIEIKLRLDALLDLRLALPLVRIGRLEMNRAPAGESPPGEKPDWRKWLGPYAFPRLAVDRLDIERLTVSPPLASLERSFAVSGDGRLGGAAAWIHLQVRRHGDPTDRVTLSLDLSGNPAMLGVDMDFAEAPGGLIGEMLGLPPSAGLTATLKGEGPVRAWSGKLAAEAAGVGRTESDLTLAVNKTVDFSLQGRVTPGPGFLPPLAAGFPTGRFDLALKGRLDPGKSLAVETMDLKSAHMAGHFQGGLDLKDDLFFGEFQVDADLGGTILPAGLEIKNGLRLEGRLSGTVLQPAIVLDGVIREPAWGGFSADRVTLHVEAAAPHPLDSRQAGFAGRGRFALEGVRAPDAGYLPQNVTAEFEAGLERMKKLIVPRLDIRAEALDIRGSGGLDLATSELNSKMDITVADLSRISPFLPGFEKTSGRAEFRLTAQGRANRPLPMAIEGRLTGIQGMPEPLPTFWGPDIHLSLNGVWESPRLNVAAFEIKGRSVIGADGWIDPALGRADLAWRGEVNGLGEFLKEERILPQDPIRIRGKFGGPLQAPTAEANVAVDRMSAVGFRFRDVAVRVDMDDLSRLKGRMKLTAAGKTGSMEAASDVALKGDWLNVTQFKMTMPGIVFTTDMGINIMHEGFLDGQALLSGTNMSGLNQFLDRSNGGSGDLKIRLKPVRGKQTAELEGSFKNASDGRLKAAALNLKAEISDLFDLNIKQLILNGQGFTAGPLRLAKFDFRANGPLDRLPFKIAAEGSLARPIKIDSEGLLSVKDPGARLTLQRLEAALDSQPIVLARPAAGYVGGGGFGIEELDLKVGTGRLSARGRVTSREAAADLALKNIPLSLASLFGPVRLDGGINGSIRASGDPRRPNLSVSLDFLKIKPDVEALSGFKPADLHLDASLQPGGLVADMKLTGFETQLGRARLVLPLRMTFLPLNFEVTPSGKLEGELEARGDLKGLPAALGLDDQIMGGQVVVDLRLTGTAGNPRAAGGATLEKGYFEHIGVGVILKDISAKISGDGDRLNLAGFSATDGGGGRLTASGGMELDAGRRFPFQVSADIVRAKIIRMDMLQATVNGPASLAGDTSKARLTGNLVVSPATMNLVRVGGGPTSLEIVKINTSRPQAPARAVKDRSSDFIMELDLGVRIPGKFVVRGYGLDSEWAGSVAVSGTHLEPRLTGRLDVVKGMFDLAGRRFNLSKGALTFTGESPPAPIIDAAAVTAIDDTQAVIRVTGSATSPEILFESTPPLPQEEILARVLFGRSASAASPAEALRLATAANQLRGKTGLDIVGKFRSLFNLDKLDVGLSDDGGATVGAGKYLSEKVYVEVQHDTVKSGESVLVEIELTPRLSLDSKASPDSPGEVGLNWKKDY